MKLKIKNIFDPEKEVIVTDLEDNVDAKFAESESSRGIDPNLVINLKDKSGFPVYVNISRTACLVLSFTND